MPGFEDCIRNSGLNKDQQDRLIKKYRKLKKKFTAAGNTDEGAAMAAEKLLNAERFRNQDKRRNLQQHLLKVEEIEEQFANTKGTAFQKTGKLFQSAQFRSDSIKRTAFKFLDSVGEHLKVTFLGNSKDHEMFLDAVRFMVEPNTSVSREAQRLGKAMRHVFDYLNARAKAAGMLIGRLDNYFPQIHRAESIRKVSKDEWVDFILTGGNDGGPLVDLSKMVNKESGMEFVDADELRPILEGVYDDITQGVKKTGRGDIDTRHSRNRFLHFADADSFLKYNDRFGTGNKGLIQAFLNNIDGMSRDVGAMEILGPRPNAMKNHLLEMIEAEEKAAGGKFAKSKVGIRRGEFNVLTSRFEQGDTDSFFYRFAAGTQNMLRSALLGSASISALSDIAFAHATARLHGLSSTRILQNHLAILKPGSSEAKKAARQFGLVMDIVADVALDETRIAGEALGNGITAHLSRMTNKLSGLDRWTKSVKAAVTVEAGTTLGEEIFAKKSWDALSTQLKESLSDAGIGKADWAFLVENKAYTQLGDSYAFVPSDFRGKPDVDFAKARDIANKIDTWYDSLRQIATNEATLNTRAITSGALFADRAGGEGTLLKLVGSSFGLFKTFPVTVLTTHTVNAFRRMAVPGQRAAGFEHAFNTIVLTGILGAGALQLKNLSKGKTAQDWKNPQFWMASFLQGGGAGIFGDFIFGGGESRFGRKPFQELSGPVGGLISDSLETLSELPDLVTGKENKFALNAFRILKRNAIPAVGSLWYTRLVTERLFLDHLERLSDPNYDSRMRRYEREMRRRKGQEFWWRPGSFQP